jgi:hypothetical protein
MPVDAVMENIVKPLFHGEFGISLNGVYIPVRRLNYMRKMKVLEGILIGALFFLYGCTPPLSSPGATAPNLVVATVQVPAAPVKKSASWTLGATITNNGTAASSVSTLTYQISNKSTLDSSATTIGTSSIPSIPAGQSHPDTYSTSYSIPQSGTYFIFATVASSTNSAPVAVIYDRIYIGTYVPNLTVGTQPVTFISLFGPNGDTTIDGNNEWGDGSTTFTADGSVALMEADGVSTYATLDYTAGLAPGTYYVRIRGRTVADVGAYAVRFLSLNSGDTPPTINTTATTPFASVNTNDTPYEVDDTLNSAGLPTNPVVVTLGAPPSETDFNRFLNVAGKDMDWFKIILP